MKQQTPPLLGWATNLGTLACSCSCSWLGHLSCLLSGTGPHVVWVHVDLTRLVLYRGGGPKPPNRIPLAPCTVSLLVPRNPRHADPSTPIWRPPPVTGRPQAAHVMTEAAESQQQRIFPRESSGPRGSLTQHHQPAARPPRSTVQPVPAVPTDSAVPTPKPRPGQRTPMAALGSPVTNHPGAGIAGSIPAPLQPPILGVFRWRWPRRAGRCCVAQTGCRRSQSPRLATRPPAQSPRRRSSAIQLPRLHFPRRGCPAAAGNAP